MKKSATRKPVKRQPVKPKARPVVKKKKVSTALARRKPAKRAEPPSTALVATAGLAVAAAVPSGHMVQLGHVAFTKEEKAIITRDVDQNKVLILPTGAPYLPHYDYTRWLNEAFGPTGWQNALLGKPDYNKDENTVYGQYCLFIRGVAVASAIGQQEYFHSNPRQSFGDAIEAAAGSGLRRCCKRLGIGLELWDKRWAARFRREHCVQVPVIARKWDKDQKKTIDRPDEWWRRHDDEPFSEEKKAKRPEAYVAKPKGDDNRPITIDQATRLWVCAKNAGRSQAEVKKFLTDTYDLKSSKDIQRKDYDEIVRKLEAPGSLVTLHLDDVAWEIGREPGEEG